MYFGVYKNHIINQMVQPVKPWKPWIDFDIYQSLSFWWLNLGSKCISLGPLEIKIIENTSFSPDDRKLRIIET